MFLSMSDACFNVGCLFQCSVRVSMLGREKGGGERVEMKESYGEEENGVNERQERKEGNKLGKMGERRERRKEGERGGRKRKRKGKREEGR